MVSVVSVLILVYYFGYDFLSSICPFPALLALSVVEGDGTKECITKTPANAGVFVC